MVLHRAEVIDRIPANKFFPPRLDQSQLLFRKELIDESINEKGKNKKIIFFEAQAGQGKTTTAIQFLEKYNFPFSWYQIGPEDADPVLTLTALLYCLKKSLPRFTSPLLENMINAGELAIPELARYTNILLNDLAEVLNNDLFLVLDDMHLLENHVQTTSLIRYLIQSSPPFLRFCLLSRKPLQMTNNNLDDPTNTLKISDQDLALSEKEIADLYNEVLETPISRDETQQLKIATDGWIMGLMLMSHSFDEKNHQALNGASRLSRLDNRTIYEYFKSEIFSYIPQHLYISLLQLSILDEIPLSLAGKICANPDIVNEIIALKNNHFFVRTLGACNKTISFHHLFREFLFERAVEQFDEAEIKRLRNEVAAYYLRKNNVVKALHYMLQSQDYDAIEMTLEIFGMNLLAMNRALTLIDILANINPDITMQQGWLSFFLGSAYLEVAPPKAYTLLINAHDIFTKAGNETGEMLAAAQIIYFQMSCGGAYNLGAKYLSRTDALYTQFFISLDTYTKVLIAKNMAFGYCFFTQDTQKSRHYATLAHSIAQRHELANFMAASQGVLIFEKYFSGDLNACRQEIEKGIIYLNNPKVSEINRMTIMGTMLNYLEDHNDQINFNRIEENLFENIQNDLISLSIVKPYLYLWKICMSISDGNPENALQLIQTAFDEGHLDYNTNLACQFLHFMAYALSLLGKENDALSAAQESLQAMETGGGNHYFIILNSLLIGSTFIQLGLLEEAEPILLHALRLSIAHKQFYLRAATYLQRAYLRLKQEDMVKAIQDIKQGLQCLRIYKITTPYSVPPQILMDLLKVAVQQGIETKYVRTIARENLQIAILPDGETLPVMYLTTLGQYKISIHGKTALDVSELPPLQRTLLGLLVTTADLKISQEQIQTLLWPDSAPDRARGSFDTLLMRLRKNIAHAIAPHPIKNYLILKKGFLILKNCRIDIHIFNRKARLGIKNSKRKNRWQAGLFFYPAMQIWQGEFLAGMVDNEILDDYRYENTQLFINASMNWAKNLIEMNQYDEAIAVLEKALRFDRFHDGLITLLYKIHVDNNHPLKAVRLLKQYEVQLKKDDYTKAEIDVIIEAILNAANLPAYQVQPELF